MGYEPGGFKVRPDKAYTKRGYLVAESL